MTGANRALRAAYPQAFATLIRIVGDFDTAQDALHEAVERALTHWQPDVPLEPTAWLVRTARNIVIDHSRKSALHLKHAGDSRLVPEASMQSAPDSVANRFRDDMLRLIFTCCHPTLSPDSQVALALRTVAGLTVDQIARIYLVSPTAMERRLVRARQALRAADIPYEVPEKRDLPVRLDAVCAVILVIFNDGYSYSDEAPTLRPRLCEQAIRLGRLVARLFRRDAEVSGLLALMLLQHSRWRARMAEPETFVSLEKQDRTLWDASLIREGRAIVQRALRRHNPGPYQIQAAIAAVHCEATAFECTDWQQIAALYDVLVQHQPTAVVKLNRAVAISFSSGPERGLQLIRELETIPELKNYHFFHAARGYVLSETGRTSDAIAAYRRAISLTSNAVEQRALIGKIVELEASSGPRS